MKKLVISILLMFGSLSVLASNKVVNTGEETPKLLKGVIIEENIKIEKETLNSYKVYGSLKDIDEKNAQKMRLQGKVFVSPSKDPSKKGYNIANIQWLGVQKTDNLDKVVGFKEPIVSSFMFKDGANIKGIPLPTFGDIQDLKRAINDLEQDKIDLEDLKRTRKFKPVHGKKDKNDDWLVGKKKAKKVQLVVRTGSLNEPGEGLQMQLNNEGVRETNMAVDPRDSYLGSLNNNGLSQGSYDNHTLPGFDGNSVAGAKVEKEKNNVTAENGNNDGKDNKGTNARKWYAQAKDYDLYVLNDLDENNPPAIQSNAVVVARGVNGQQMAYFVRNGNFVRDRNDRLISRPANVNVGSFVIDPKGKVVKDTNNQEQVESIINELMFDFNNHAKSKGNDGVDFGPEIRVEVTEQGCNPEHDALQERVIITARTKRYENNNLVNEGVCERTLEMYPVKRDYLCEACVDEVNLENKKAFARYQEHWFDKNGERHNLNIKVDEGHPFKVFEESKGCPYDIEAEEGYAIKTSKIGYLSKFGIFIPVAGCHITDRFQKFKVIETADGCSQLSIEGQKNVQTRLVLKKENKTIEVRECRPSNIELLKDRTPCSGQYIHDFENEKTYTTAQYYYENEGQKHYVGECQKTGDFIEHQTEVTGWTHDDTHLISKPIFSIYINDDSKVFIKENQGESVAYQNQGSKTILTSNFHYQGCYKITHTQLYNVYQRGDCSTYEKLMGEGNTITSGNLCTKSIEYQTLNGIPYYRNVTRYPDGHWEADAWAQ